jgi:putative SOS response-associated peptidase YedK
MPVILPVEAYPAWLNRQSEAIGLKALLVANDYQNFQLTPISSRINNPAHNDNECLQAVTL